MATQKCINYNPCAVTVSHRIPQCTVTCPGITFSLYPRFKTKFSRPNLHHMLAADIKAKMKNYAANVLTAGLATCPVSSSQSLQNVT